MLINADVKSLEVFVAADRYQDHTLREELLNKLDLHSLNQERFKLPDRVTAKRFIFKLLYGATAYGYSVDSDFIDVGYSEKKWQGVIDEFYNKYTGIAKGHNRDIQFAKENGYLTVPSGRYYNYQPERKHYGFKWPLTKIKNYPIQGFGADLVMLARIEFWQQLQESGFEAKFIQTIHDSLVVDVDCSQEQGRSRLAPNKSGALDNDPETCYNISMLLRNAIEKVPELCKREFDYDFSLPIWCEIQQGMNKADMSEVKFN